jgi:UDP-2,3-diacylglucosamine hydrolase
MDTNVETKKRKIYFVSDAHLGLPDFESSLRREKKLVKWLDAIKADAAAIYLLGDIFDFWHEWKRSAPQGFTRFLGKLAELSDAGIPIHMFTGNHDIWVYNYLPREIGLILHRDIYKTELFGKKFLIGHGDGLGPGDGSYKLLKLVFTNKPLQWLFRQLHPDFALWLGQTWSGSRRMVSRKPVFYGEKEWLIQYSKKVLEKEFFHYFVFGHRHLPGIHPIGADSAYVNTGDWLSKFSYAVFDGETFELRYFADDKT